MKFPTVLFRYPGGKRKLAPILYHFFGQHEKVMETMVGGGAFTLYLLSQYTPKQLWLNDADPDISSVWQCIVNCPDKIIERLLELNPTVPNYQQFIESKSNNHIDRAVKKFALHQWSHSGLGEKAGSPIGGWAQKGKYKIDCRWNAPLLEKRIQAIHAALSNVDTVVTCNTAQKLDPEGWAMYLDPPYFVQGNGLYKHGMSFEDHINLAVWLMSHKNWTLSYDDCPEIRDLYSWATIHKTTAKYVISIKTKPTKTELVIQP